MLDLPETTTPKTCTASIEKDETSLNNHIYEKQRDYYFGGDV